MISSFYQIELKLGTAQHQLVFFFSCFFSTKSIYISHHNISFLTFSDSSLFIFPNQVLPHKEDGISQTGKLNKVYKMVEGMSFLCHECVGLRLGDFHLLNLSWGQGGVQQSPRKYWSQHFKILFCCYNVQSPNKE